MGPRIISAILVAIAAVVCSTDVLKGQSTDSLLYIIENDLVNDDADKYEMICRVIRNMDDAESRIRYCEQAIELAQKLDIRPAQPYLLKGEAYLDCGDLALALECLLHAVRYYEKTDNSIELGTAYLLMAETYNTSQGFRENEKLYLQNALEIFEQEKDSLRLSIALQNLGYANYKMGQYDTALVIYRETLDLFNQLNHPYLDFANIVCRGNLGLVYSRLSDDDKAEEYLLTAIDTLAGLGDERYLPEFMTEYANILWQKGESKQAIAYASRVVENTDNPYFQREASRLLARLYENSGRFDSAYYYQTVFSVASDSASNIDNVLKLADLLTEYELERIQAEVDVLEKKKQINRIIIIGLGIILLLSIGLVTLYYTNLRRSRKFARVLEEKNDEIIDSINYAERIQSAILPPETYFTELLNENFILYKPRDIVSGDFYWIKQVNQYIILAAADCTGHGVPGAFMSMLGTSYLNEIVQRREITQANQVLNEMRRQIIHSLRQHGQHDEAKDGIDMALCVIDQKTRMMQYAGAINPLYLIKESNGKPELTEIKADRMPLGYHQGRAKSFTNQNIQLDYGDVFYMFSDGYMDQKGGGDHKKFMSKNFKKLLLKICQEPMPEQKHILEKTMVDWMGDSSQIDDILVIGVRV